jgi:hypothetical protein
MKKIATLLLSLLLLMGLMTPAVMAAGEITVYVSVADNGAAGIGEKTGEPMVAVPVTVPKGSVVDDVLLALHLKECNGGAAGYKSTKMDMYGSTTYYISTWFGRPIEYADNAKSVTAWKNHNMSTGLGSTVKDGDVVDVCVYTTVSTQNFTMNYYGLAWMDYYEVDAGVGENFTVGCWRSAMDMATFQYNTEPCVNMPVTVNGMNSNFKVQSDGSLALAFSEAGTYYVCVGGDTAYGAALMKVNVTAGGSFTGHEIPPPGRMAASGLEGEAGGSPITVYATITDYGSYCKSEKTGENLIAAPITVPQGATLDDVLNAINAQHANAGEEGYSSASMEMGGGAMYYVTGWFGASVDGSTGATRLFNAYVGTDMTSTLATPVKDGDFIYASIYGLGEAAPGSFGYSYEYYGLGYFDYPTAEAGVGDEVVLHPYTEAMAGMMGGEYRTTPLTDMDVFINGEKSDVRVDSTGELKLSFDKAGVYDILVAGDVSKPAAAMRLTVSEGAAFDPNAGNVDISDVLLGNLSAPGRGTGDPVTVYVTVTDKGNYAMSETTGEYMIAIPVSVPGGSTVDDVLQKFNDMESTAGAMGYSSTKMDMWGSTMYTIAKWFGKANNSMDGSDYSITAWRNRSTTSTLAEKVEEGDLIDVNIYGVKSSMNWSYSYWGLAYFDFGTVKAGVNDEIVLTAYHSIMDAQSFRWNDFVSSDLTVFVNGEKSSYTVGSDGKLKIKFDQPGTYYVLAQPADDSYGAAAAKIIVEEGASFKDNAPQTVVDNALAPVTKVNYGPIAKIGLIALAVVIIVIAVLRAVKKGKKKDKEEE